MNEMGKFVLARLREHAKKGERLTVGDDELAALVAHAGDLEDAHAKPAQTDIADYIQPKTT